jgi:hypothetical protein
MNERINKLAKQAVFESYKAGCIDQKEIVLEKFAELIVKECMSIATKGMEDIADGCYVVSPAQLQQFAELIVRDCAEAALAKGRASPDTDFRTGSYVISEYLLSRYGVE